MHVHPPCTEGGSLKGCLRNGKGSPEGAWQVGSLGDGEGLRARAFSLRPLWHIFWFRTVWIYCLVNILKLDAYV